MSRCGNFAAQDGQVSGPRSLKAGVYILLSLATTTNKLNSKAPLKHAGAWGQHIPIGQSSLPLQHLVSKRLERYPRLDGTALSESDAGSSKIAIANAEERFNAGICQRS